MAQTRRRALSLLSAIGLAALTLATFASLQEYGPESAIRKFHRAVLNEDSEGLREVVVRGTPQWEMNELARRVLDAAYTGLQFQIVSMRRLPDSSVIAVVAYFFPNRDMARIQPWVAKKEYGRWRVDAVETVMFIPKTMRLQP